MSEVGKSQEKELANAIATARKAAGFTQQQLCQVANLSYSTLAKIERGAIKTPSVFTVATIAAATGTTVESLTGISTVAPKPVISKDYKTSKNGVTFVFFDINGVLVRFFQRAFTQISLDTGISPDSIEATFWHHNDALCKGQMSLQEFNTILAQRIGLPTNEINWKDYYINSLDPIKEMIECLIWTSEFYHFGLLSNTMTGFIDSMISEKILPTLPYDAIIDSSKIGYIKPEQEIYEIATQQAGVPPGQILLIDDSRPNLMAAEHLGWHVLWFDGYRPDEGAQRLKNTLSF